MAGMSVDTHQFIVNRLGMAAQAIRDARAAVRIPNGYSNFELAAAAIQHCEVNFGPTWEATRDANTALPQMEAAYEHMGLFEAGLAGPSVKAARKYIADVITALKKYQVPGG